MVGHRIRLRASWMVTLALVAVAAFLAARGVVHLAVARMLPEVQAFAASPRSFEVSAAAKSTATRALSAGPILARNPFDHAASLTPRTARVAASPLGLDPLDPRTAPTCDGVRAHVITASSDPAWSFVALSSAADSHAVLRRRGGALGTKKVHFVGWDRVWLAESGASPGLCQAELFARDAVAVPPAVTAATPTVTDAPVGPLLAEALRGIVRVSATDYAVDRATLERILDNQDLFLRATRIQPESVGGRVAGARLFGVKPGTLLDALGLREGDRLDAINGFQMTSPEGALEAYARLRGAERVTLKLDRAGHSVTLDYVIR